MNACCYILTGLIVICAMLLAAGLYRPWWVLWWMSIQNRLKVIMLYLPVTIILLLLRGWMC